MRILVHEYVSGGGLAGRPLPPALAGQGAAMLQALVTDLSALPAHAITTTVDPRVPLRVPANVHVEALSSGAPDTFLRLVDTADAVWLIAPESNGVLASLARTVEAAGRRLIGPGAAAIDRAANKAGLATQLERERARIPAGRRPPWIDCDPRTPGRDAARSRRSAPVPTPRSVRPADRARVAVPPTRVLWPSDDVADTAQELGYPVVVKPARGAGCEGVARAIGPAELTHAVRLARRAAGRERILLQPWIRGTAASVALVGDGRRVVPLALNTQHLQGRIALAYEGGETPLIHPLAERAIERAVQVCEAIGGLRGYIGVDAVLTDADAVVIEINPRLTTAYLGVRAATDVNPAALALASCWGSLPARRPRSVRRVRFAASGRVCVVEDSGVSTA